MSTSHIMQVIFHAGAHKTDDDRLVRCLMRNKKLLADNGAHVPSREAYRQTIRDIMINSPDHDMANEFRAALTSEIDPQQPASRIILSYDSFFGTPRMAAAGGKLYSAAEQRLISVISTLPDVQFEFYFALRNPAGFLPALLPDTPFDTMPEFLNGVDPSQIKWSDLIQRIRTRFPDMPITLWCNEDTPLIWSELFREMAGLEPTTTFKGENILLPEIMTKPGMERFNAYLKSHPGMSAAQKRRVIAAFLDKFAIEDAVEEELDIPGWTDEMIEHLTELYDEDVYAMQRIPGVNFISP